MERLLLVVEVKPLPLAPPPVACCPCCWCEGGTWLLADAPHLLLGHGLSCAVTGRGGHRAPQAAGSARRPRGEAAPDRKTTSQSLRLRCSNPLPVQDRGRGRTGGGAAGAAACQVSRSPLRFNVRWLGVLCPREAAPGPGLPQNPVPLLGLAPRSGSLDANASRLTARSDVPQRPRSQRRRHRGDTCRLHEGARWLSVGGRAGSWVSVPGTHTD